MRVWLNAALWVRTSHDRQLLLVGVNGTRTSASGMNRTCRVLDLRRFMTAL